MKKTLALFIALSIVTVSLFSFGASANFGKGVEVVSSDVKLIKTALFGEKICFTDADFKAALCIGDFDSITITSIPNSKEGTLLFAGRKIGEGKTIRRRNIASLVFVPASKDVTECKFTFTIDGFAGGNSIECILMFVDKINYEPTIDEESESVLTLKTQSNIGIYGRMTATDPEGDDIEYIIVSYPKNGFITVNDMECGKYKYTPTNQFIGDDKFVYVARDSYGNYSSPVTVNITVVKRTCDTVYTDMLDRSEYNAAVAVTAMGLMNGTIQGNDIYFSPDKTVTKAEFLALSMKALGIAPDSTATKTFFDDTEDIPNALIGYVSVAQRAGIVKGEFKNGALNFKPNDPITKYEAAKIMAELLNAKATNAEEDVFADYVGVPVSARAAVFAMYSLGIYDESTNDLSGNVTRADCAEFMYRMVK